MATDINLLIPTDIRAALLGASSPSASNVYMTASAVSTGYVPYTGATANVNLGAFSLISPSIYGSTSASGTLTLSSTNNATKGKLLFGTSAYDEVNNRLGIGISSPAYDFDLTKSVPASYVAANVQNTSATGYSFIETLGDNNVTFSSLSVFNSAGGVGTFYDNDTAGVATNSATLSFLINENASGGWVLTAGGYGTANEKQRWTINQTSFKQAAATSGAITTYTFTKPNNTGQTASTPINGFLFTTGNRQWATGAITTQKEFEITSPTYSFVGASTITNAYTFYVNAPTASTNATITNNYAAGFGGNVLVGTTSNNSQRILQISQDTAFMSFGSLVGATNKCGIYFNVPSPSQYNYNIYGDASTTYINGNTQSIIQASNTNVITVDYNKITFSVSPMSSGALTAFNFNSPTNTGQTASTEIPNFKVTGNTKTWAAGAITTQRWNYFTANTAAFAAASTITNSYGLYVEQATAGTNATITNNWALGLSGGIEATIGTGTFRVTNLSGSTTQSAIYMNNTTAIGTTNYVITSTNSTATFNGRTNMSLAAGGTSYLNLNPAANSVMWSFSNANKTGNTASTELNQFKVTGSSLTWDNGGGATTIATQRWNYFTANTAATSGGGSLTITDSFALYAEAATASGVTITNNWAFGTNGDVIFDTLGTGSGAVQFRGLVGTTSQNAMYLGVALGSETSSNYTLNWSGSLNINSQATTSAIDFQQGSQSRFTMYGASTSGSNPRWLINFPQQTNITASTETPDILINSKTQTWASGNISTQRGFYWKTQTYAFASASTITNSYGLYVEAATAGTNATITNNYAAGFDGAIHINSTSNSRIVMAATNSYLQCASNMRIVGGSEVFIDAGGATATVRTSNTLWQNADGLNFQFGSTSGNKIGTATTQKFAFWNATPIVQPTTAVTAATFVAVGGTTVQTNDTFDGYTVGQVVKALRNTGLLA